MNHLSQLFILSALMGFPPAVSRWAELVPLYAIGSVAMFWVVQRVAAF